MKRILIDARMHTGTPHGIARYSQRLALGIAQARPEWEVGVWTRDPRVWSQHREAAPNLRTLAVSARPFSPSEHWQLPRSVLSFRPDLVHYTSLATPIWMPGRSLVTVHDLIPLHFPPSWIHRVYLNTLTRLSLLQCSRVACVSQHTANDLAHFLPRLRRLIRVAPNGGLDPLPESPPVQRSRPYFLCVANPKPHKNLATLLEAFRSLEDRCDLVLVSSSAPWLEEELRQRPALERLHGLSDDELAGLYRGARATVVPSLYEGFGLPALEAMQLGSPLICARSSSLVEVAGLACLNFEPLDTTALSDALELALVDEGLRQHLRERGRVQAERFSWQRCVQDHLDIYEECLEGRQN